MFENSKRLLDRSLELGIPGLDLIIYQGGREVYRSFGGVRDERGVPMNGKELYNIYSCSKFITCSAALTLLEEGKFSLDDDIAEYIPAFGDMTVKKNGTLSKAERRIKIFNLFTMTSGLCYDPHSPEIELGKRETEGRCPTVGMMDYIAKMPLSFEPGESWQYSFSHDVIAALVEVVSGKRFGLYVKEKILDPLGMKNTTYLFPDSRLDEICAQYIYDKEKREFQNIGRAIRNYKLGSEYESGGAGAVSTVEDYILFLEGLRTGKIISPDTIAKMKTDYLTEAQRPACWVSEGYGYGLGVRTPDSSGKRTDFGWNGAAGAFAAIDEKNEISLYYAQHVMTSPVRPLQPDYIEAAKLDLGFEAYEEGMWCEAVNPLAGIY